MTSLEEIVNRLLHIQDLKLTVLQLNIRRGEAMQIYSNENQTGLGLPSSFQLVKDYDGQIERQMDIIRHNEDEVRKLVKGVLI